MTSTSRNLFLAPCSRTHKKTTFRHFHDSVIEGIDPTEYEEAIDFDKQIVSVWGVVSGNQSHWKQMQPGDIVLFYSKSKVYTHIGRVIQKQENEALANQIWTTYDEGRIVADMDEPWPYLFYLTDVEEVNISSAELHDDIGWKKFYPQSFTRVIDKRHAKIEDKYGSISACLRHHRTESAGPDPTSVSELATELLEPSTADPPLTESQVFTEKQRQIRREAFQDAVRTAYDESCAFCGSNRQTIAGAPEVNAAYIHPKTEGGVDDVRNGLALCGLHKWTFETGWATATDDYAIQIAHHPETETYQNISDLSGQQLHLPDKDSLQPLPKFLRKHRKLYGFE